MTLKYDNLSCFKILDFSLPIAIDSIIILFINSFDFLFHMRRYAIFHYRYSDGNASSPHKNLTWPSKDGLQIHYLTRTWKTFSRSVCLSVLLTWGCWLLHEM